MFMLWHSHPRLDRCMQLAQCVHAQLSLFLTRRSKWVHALSLQDAVRGDHGEVVSLLLHHGGKVTNKEGHLIDLADSHLSGNVRIFGDIDPEWEVDPKQIVFDEKVRIAIVSSSLPSITR